MNKYLIDLHLVGFDFLIFVVHNSFKDLSCLQILLISSKEGQVAILASTNQVLKGS